MSKGARQGSNNLRGLRAAWSAGARSAVTYTYQLPLYSLVSSYPPNHPPTCGVPLPVQVYLRVCTWVVAYSREERDVRRALDAVNE